MKKLLLSLAVILSSTALTVAQKNTTMLSGTVAYTKTTDVKASYTITPLVGYFVTDKVAVGAFGDFAKVDADNKTTNVGVFARCHFMNVGKKLQVFSQLDLSSNSTTEDAVKVKSTCASLWLGANYSITKKLDLTTNLTNLITYEKSEGVATTTVGFTGVANPLSATGFGLIYKF